MPRSRSRSPKRDHRRGERSKDNRDRNRDVRRERDFDRNHGRDRDGDRDTWRDDSRRPLPSSSRRIPQKRSRSRSPFRRSRSRSVEKRRRSRSPDRIRSTSRDRSSKSTSNTTGGAVPKYLLERPDIKEEDLEGKSPEEQEMLKLMGFSGFDSTKGKKVPGNDVSAVHIVPKRKYRQYMNRKGGFNRPLDHVS